MLVLADLVLLLGAALQISWSRRCSLVVGSLFEVTCVGSAVRCLGRAWALQYPCPLLLVFTEVLPTCDCVMGGPELLASCSSPALLALPYLTVRLSIAAIIVKLSGRVLLEL